MPPPRCLRFATRFPTRLEFLSFSSSGRRISFSLGRHRLSIPRSRRLPLPIPAGYSILAKQFLRKTLFSNVLKSRRANVGAKRGDLATRISKMQTTYQEANRCVQRRGIERTRNARFVFNGIFLTEKNATTRRRSRMGEERTRETMSLTDGANVAVSEIGSIFALFSRAQSDRWLIIVSVPRETANQRKGAKDRLTRVPLENRFKQGLDSETRVFRFANVKESLDSEIARENHSAGVWRELIIGGLLSLRSRKK